MSKLVIAKNIITPNNGVADDKTNKCGIISIAQSTKTDIDFMINFLKIGKHEQLDFNKFKHKIKELSDLLGFCIHVHTAKFLQKGITRIWIDDVQTVNPTDGYKSYDVHILWYGDHFEYVDWSKINDYPDYHKELYELVEPTCDTSEEFLFNYNVNLVA